MGSIYRALPYPLGISAGLAFLFESAGGHLFYIWLILAKVHCPGRFYFTLHGKLDGPDTYCKQLLFQHHRTHSLSIFRDGYFCIQLSNYDIS